MDGMSPEPRQAQTPQETEQPTDSGEAVVLPSRNRTEDVQFDKAIEEYVKVVVDRRFQMQKESKRSQKTYSSDESSNSDDGTPIVSKRVHRVIEISDVEKFAENESSTESGSESVNTETHDPKTIHPDEPEKTGMKCKLKQLYPTDIQQHSWWTDQKPFRPDADKSRYAIIVRNVFNETNDESENRTRVDSIVVQSPLLRTVLQSLLQGYPGVGVRAAKLTFRAPFKPFVHRWQALQTAAEEEKDPETARHLNILISALKEELHESLESAKSFFEHNEISFQHLWTLFVPKEYVYSAQGKTDCAFQLKRTDYATIQGRQCLLLHCDYVDWDGEKFGKASKILVIPQYAGSAALQDLNSYPLKYHSNKHIQTQLQERGRKFQQLSGYHYRAYEGVAVDMEKERQHVTGRIVVDTHTYKIFNAEEQINLTSLEHTYEEPVQEDELNPYHHHHHRMINQNQNYSKVEVTSAFEKTKIEPIKVADLSDEQLLICSHTVRGFSLKAKEWMHFEIDSIRDIQWNDSAFNNLVLPEGYKKLLLAFAKSQRASSQVFDDVVRGKGRGIVMLLNGPPGVGKTLTAESVAEEMQVPLYTLTAGDLGHDPSSVEKKLTRVFSLAKCWNAVVLLDEADVFLEKRRIEDLVRNELVSIFLQNLEYFQGTLFLTTNRVEAFDPAFESRIHISIAYPNLNPTTRRQVWENFLNLLSKDQQKLHASQGSIQYLSHEIENKDLESLSREDLNGRQIKNIIKSAGLLALEENAHQASLKMSHVETVLRIMNGA